MDKFVNKRLDQISLAGNSVGVFMRGFFNKTWKILASFGVLILFGVVVFVWGAIEGIKKKE